MNVKNTYKCINKNFSSQKNKHQQKSMSKINNISLNFEFTLLDVSNKHLFFDYDKVIIFKL